MRVAAIDVGSNSIRLLVADFAAGRSGSSASTVARAGEICRLGRGLHRGGAIEPTLVEQAARIVADFRQRAEALGAARVIVGATAALRHATNGPEVAQGIEERSGLRVRILSGADEARLVYRAVVHGLGVASRRGHCVVFDLGGGSTEVVSGVGDQPGRWVSLRLGAVSLTERHLRSDPPAPPELAELEAHVRGVLMHECALFPEKAPVLAGVGGTVTVLASLDRGLPSYDPLQLEGWAIPPRRVEELYRRLAFTRHDQRRAWPLVGEGRADIVVAGAAVVNLLLERFPAPALTCSTQGLRYGLARLAAEEAGLPE
jgi:exopolyphosphatase/guanosine-5'-triphosphate,3'-diphosphate pyrophosphatase